MKNITKILIVSIMTLAFLVPAVHAQSPQQRAEVNEPGTPSQGTDKEAAREQRTAERKERLQIKLDAAASQRIKSRCKNAQGKINSLGKRINGIQTSRQQKYTNLLSRLDRLVQQLQTRGLDTAGLEASITELEQLLEDYETAMENHVVALDDLVAIDCEADPEAFQAALSDARDSLGFVKSSTTDIKEFLNNDVKTELKTIRQALVDATEDEDQTEEPSDEEEPVSTDPDQPVSSEVEQ